MMRLAHFLHIYQPYDQHPGILEKIVNESYRPLLRGFIKVPQAKVTMNINAVLTEKLFEHGYRDVLDDIKMLVEMGRLELVGSAKYHAFLPLIPESEVERQVALNHETNKRYFGDAFSPKGFFSPEMAYSPKVAAVVKKFGYKWMLVDESAARSSDNTIINDKIYKLRDFGLEVYFREKEPSNVLMGALVRSAESFEKALGSRVKSDTYIITAMDGETFGHHRPGLEAAFFDILACKDFETVLISELKNIYPRTEEVILSDSTWAASIKDIKNDNPFALWADKTNKIHGYEWDLADLAIAAVNDSKYSDSKYPQLLEEKMDWDDMTQDQKQEEKNKRQWIRARDMLDKALNSDPWWWASAKPWWSVEMIEKGVNALYKVVLAVPDASDEQKGQAEDYYKNVLFTAHEWQRNGIVDKMEKKRSKERNIPLSKRFAAGSYYKALLEALRRQEDTAAERREYEQAIKWRDGQYKLERDLDIYDAVHIMDLFRSEGKFKQFEKLLAEYRKKYQEISRGQPE